MRLYRYVGPDDIRRRAEGRPLGAVIASQSDLETWIRTSCQAPDPGGVIAATFVIDTDGRLQVARHSEHAARAGGGPVLSAGEMFFRRERRGWVAADVSNLSTGYCPEPESWPGVAAALRAAGLPPPDGFDPAIPFRCCPGCGERNVVKDGCFVCEMCGADLPEQWNFERSAS